MLVIYDKTNGFISQTVMSGEFEILRAHYERDGYGCLWSDDPHSIDHIYILDDKIVQRPFVEVSADRPLALKADGVDTINLVVVPKKFTLIVQMNDQIIYNEQDDTGSIEFTVEHPGTYSLRILAAFPYRDVLLTIEATS